MKNEIIAYLKKHGESQDTDIIKMANIILIMRSVL